MLRIWLFGSLSVAHGIAGGRVTPVSGRCGSLLAYLALGRGRYFSRSELLGILWPEQGLASSSAGSFNTALWRLRRLVECEPLRNGDLIASDRRGGIGLNGSADIWLDTEEFERHIASGLGKAIEQLADPDIDGLRTGVGLYKSDILVDFTDEWALREREKHRRLYLNALWRLMQVATIRGMYGEGIRHAQSILDFDALREDVHRELMRLFVLNGQRAQALQQFETCRQLLWRELVIGPMRETMELYRSIADSAITGREASALKASPVAAIVPSVPEPSSLPLTPSGQVRSLVVSARQHLALADAQLEQSLRHTGS
jgi:DNA-binding SARP family transcriptional activator